LLHEGSGSAAVNAFVEIVFDNSDHRFQHENSDEVVLRRTIGLKKDEFFLQRKRTSKSEIQSLLEGAGFSKSNPYFIVQQGKVQDLCTMSDAARLRLLKEVAGTTVYDEKKNESLIKMEENRNSIEKITEMLDNINERLQELNDEKEELSAYQQLDRERRAAQYGLYTLELQKARNQLDQLETDRAQQVQLHSELYAAAEDAHIAIRNTEAVLKSKSSQVRHTRHTITGLEDDKKQAVTAFTKLDLECKELQDGILQGDELAASNQIKLKELEKEIEKAQTELNQNVIPSHDMAVSKMQSMKDERDRAVKKMESLYAKQGRGKLFRTKKERDAFLSKSKDEFLLAKGEKENELANQQDALANLRRTLEKESSEIQIMQQDLVTKNAAHQSLQKMNDEKVRQRLEHIDMKRDCWRQMDVLQEQVREARDVMHTCLSDTKKVIPRNTAMGLDALRSIVDQEKIKHGEEYFGMLMENMKLKDNKYQAAVEVAAQNALFHVIVDNDHTAALLLKRLEDGKLGRVTFLPLNQLRIDPVQYPDSNDIRPMLDLCLEYDPKVSKAMQHVFSKKLVARTQELASEWSTKLNMDAVTLDGDLCSRKGALTGGFVDAQKSRLLAYERQIDAQTTLKNVEMNYNGMKKKAQDIDENIQILVQELQKLQTKQLDLSRQISTKESDIDRLESRVINQTKQIETLEKSAIPTLERSINEIDGDIQRLLDEMSTELRQTFTDEDRESLNELKSIQERINAEIEQQLEIVDIAELSKNKLQSLLQNNLLKRRRELTEGPKVGADNDGTYVGEDGPTSNRRGSHRMSTAAVQHQRKTDFAERVHERDASARVLDDVETRLDEARQVEANLRKELLTAKSELEVLRGVDMNNAKALEEAQDQADRFLTKRAMFTSKRENNMRKIQELGSLPPPSELKKFSNRSASSLEKALDGINNKLTKYSHVNKKAFDQYVNFNETRVRLLKRKEELDHGAEKVKDLIDSLDQKKDEAINRTFRGVSKHFKDVFKELVPNGAGELILRTEFENGDAVNDDDDDDAATDKEEETATSEDGSPPRKKKTPSSSNYPDVSLYRGIGIKVRFSEVGENYIMSQLSGGQKALVALGLIFAIQRTSHTKEPYAKIFLPLTFRLSSNICRRL
jgi:structural maintenance of chromosome 3 (chondroitin sulfate proteoglycan 6)